MICKTSALRLALIFSAVVLDVFFPYRDVYSQNANLFLTGQYAPFLQLSAGSPPATHGQNAIVSNQGTGALATASVPDAEDFMASIDFGDLAKGNGTPVIGGVGLRIRSNTGFRLVTSVTSFQVTSLSYRGNEVENSDGGRFIHVFTGSPSATGSLAIDLGQVAVNPQLSTGITLSELAHGSASASSTVVISAPTASVGGSPASTDNALEVPVFFSIPTGFELGPAPGATIGSFAFSLQFGLIGRV